MRRLPPALFTVMNLLSAAAFTPDAPCATATRACTEMVGVAGAAGQTLVYRSYPLDKKNDALSSRGWQCEAQQLLSWT
jgi:hypothetical protein